MGELAVAGGQDGGARSGRRSGWGSSRRWEAGTGEPSAEEVGVGEIPLLLLVTRQDAEHVGGQAEVAGGVGSGPRRRAVAGGVSEVTGG
jgi:hypothetical protein